MPNYPQKTLRLPRKKYTLVNQCVDPPHPVCYTSSNNLKTLMRLFNRLREDEIENGGPPYSGAEWDITLYEHTPESGKPTLYLEDSDNEYSDEPYIYAVDFPGSKTIAHTDCWDVMEEAEKRKNT